MENNHKNFIMEVISKELDDLFEGNLSSSIASPQIDTVSIKSYWMKTPNPVLRIDIKNLRSLDLIPFEK